LSEDDIDIEKLVTFIDKNFKPIGRREVFKASKIYAGILITIIILFVYVIALSPYTPIQNQIPWALSFTALLLASVSFMQVSRKWLAKRLIKQQYDYMYPLLNDKREQTKYFLLSLLTMKIKNPNLELLPVYNMNKELFEKKKLIERLYE